MTQNTALDFDEQPAVEDMKYVAGGVFTMGSDNFYPEESPSRKVSVDPFLIDEAPVTNANFAKFVAATGHITFAEIAPNSADYPGMPPEMAHAGSAVFHKTLAPVDTSDPGQWWTFAFGADWRHPLGQGSDVDGLDDHPVVHIAYSDAEAYAQWTGKALPTEAEWECAARGGLEGEFAWGDELTPYGAMLANY